MKHTHLFNAACILSLFVVVFTAFALLPGVANAQVNLALNPSRTGFPHPLESDRGWGGGADQWGIVDGHQNCPTGWACGLAFCGGRWNYCGQPAGLYHSTINFGEPVTFNQVVVWWQTPGHTPQDDPDLSYWDDGTSQWISLSFTRHFEMATSRDDYVFPTVTGSKVRVSFDNRGLAMHGLQVEHGWIYEFEVFAPETPVSVEASHDIIGVDRIADTPIFDVIGGDVFTYTIAVENPFEQAAYFMVSETLDMYLDYVLDSLTVDGALYDDAVFAGGDLLYADHLLDAGETLSLAFDVQVQDAALVGWSFESTAWLTAYLDPFDIPGTTLAMAEVMAPQGQVTQVPEPSTFLLLGIGILGAVGLRRRCRQSTQ